METLNEVLMIIGFTLLDLLAHFPESAIITCIVFTFACLFFSLIYALTLLAKGIASFAASMCEIIDRNAPQESAK